MLRKVKGGRAKAAALPKRSRVDDAYSDPDDAEIQRLEAKLGLKGTKKSKNAKLARALERVGMGTGLDGLFSSIEEMEERIESGLPPPEAGTSESDDDSDAPDVVSRQTAAAVVSEESNESESSIDDEATDDESEEGESEGEEPHVGPGVNTDGGGGLAAPSAGAWIPPHRRGLLKGHGKLDTPSSAAAPSAGAAKKKFDLYGKDTPDVAPSARATFQQLDESHPEYSKIKRRVQGVVNKLSEANLEPLSTEICALYDTHSKAIVNTALSECLSTIAGTDTQVLRPLIMVYAGLVSALHIRVDNTVSGFILERVVRKFMELSKLSLSSTVPTPGEDGGKGPDSKQANNLLLFLCYLCVFNTVHHNLIFSIMDLLVNRLCEWDVEVLLLAFQHCAFHLRGEDSERLKGILSRIEEKSRVAAGGTVPVRLEVMLELIQDVRNKRMKQAQQHLLERGSALRKWLNRLASRLDQSGIDRRFRASLEDICNIERTGRWWLVGASWVGRKAADVVEGSVPVPGDGGVPAAVPIDDTTVDDGEMREPNADAALLALAKAQRMNTIVKRNVFVALMGAEDVESAMDRVLKLGLRGAAEREIVRVLVDCCGQEATYNPFYADVGVKLCSFNGKFKFTFQLAFWDEFKGIESHPIRRVYNHSRLLAKLFLKHSLSIAMLKVLEFTSLSKNGLLFLRSCFSEVLTCQDSENVRGIFSRAGAGPDKLLVRDGLLIFIQKYMKTAGKSVPEAKQALYSSNFRVAKRALESITNRDEEFDF